MIKNFTFILVILILQSTLNFGQNQSQQEIIGVMSFSAINSAQSSRAIELQEIVTEVLSSKKNITLLDRSKVEQIELELKKQKQGNYIDGVTVAQNKSYGAKNLLNGSLTILEAEATTTNTSGGINMLTKKEIPSTSVTSYRSKISFALQIVDVETGQIISSKTFDFNSKSTGLFKFDGAPSYDSKEEALNGAFKGSKKQISAAVNDWINSIYPHHQCL